MELSIAIVNYQTKTLLASCLRSISQSALVMPYELLVVDNHSTDGSAEYVRASFPEINLLENKDNIGFARAANQAFERSTGKYFLLLNPDVSVAPGAIASLVEAMDSRSEVGVCAPRLLNPDGSLQYSCRTDYTLTSIIFRRTFLGSIFSNHRAARDHLMMDWDHATTRQVDWVLGAAILIRRAAIQSHQLMDERFFLYFEDVDLCLRLRKAGWKILYYPHAVMFHQHRRESANGLFNRAKLEHLKSWLKFEWKHRGGLKHLPSMKVSS